MKTIKTLSKYLILFSIVLTSCTNDEKKDPTRLNSQNTIDYLHLSFKTPDWERKINCDKLDLYPNEINDSTSTVLASSASTNETFCFSYPRDSSKIVKAKILKKHKIMATYENNEPFQFSQKLPLDANSIDDTTKRLISLEGFSETEYNQVVAVKYLKSEPKYAVFIVECKYEMKANVISSSDISKPITGTFIFKIRTNKK
ncbi:hypothetical protein [Flavobacterium taihuense]|uniref:Lipoprotein n=1 Tax=Flavobacterium taihuense TaxID=2857508 RepID=A0ABS6Y289_9FLAO|nr:hypothetical protein [Flavobacterium taihuense]MBW4362737.1 hypothetical protein [Flavobacterium taihuense]